ncbi:glycine betaine ABC transporter substrate-binding protein [Klenkia sp. LSe6-5]|uniref:Glycine betaine ABC transporter substrate-binding protein n=1 Tax=Klenkia sesuvii TaxID=3103137 RepID=A0ABU8DTH4_9ACTN
MRRVVAALLTAPLLLAGCGLQAANQYTPEAEPGTIQPVAGSEGVQLVVGAKNFTEQLILGKIAVIALQTAGFDVLDRSNIPGSVPVRVGSTSGEFDMNWEYTGTAWLTYLGMAEGIPDREEQYEAVREADLANGLTWLPPAEMNNTYAFAIRSEAAADLGVSRLSDIANLPVEDRTFCVEAEFASRNDGFVPMLEAYDLPLGSPDGVPRDNVSTLDTGAVYTATDQGACNFGEVFTTDGRIESLDLTVLEDDRQFFPAYNVAPVIYTQTLEAHPEVADVFAEITPLITDDVMIELNRRVDVDGEEPVDVALDWMRSEGLVS